MLHQKPAGFTLIELLVVIVVLGILTGVLIVVVNPNVQKEKAKEGVIKGNLDKIGQAVISCISSEVTPYSSCDTFTEIGVIDPSGNPDGSTYSITPQMALNGDLFVLVGGEYTLSTGTTCIFSISNQVSPVFETTRGQVDCHTTW